jgi:hypothetical protein
MSGTDTDLWSRFKGFMGGTVISSINEIYSLIPDSILFGSILLYFLTQNISFGVFAVFIFETIISHRLISWMFTQTSGPSRPVDIKCRTGYKTPRFDLQRMFSHQNYPSYGVFSLTSIGAYLALAMSEFSNTLDAMGAEWSSRKTVAYVFMPLVLIGFIITRWYSNCEPISEIMIAFILALVVAILFFHINRSIFGQEAMNFLGLPYIVSKESEGAPIYVCSAENTE